LLLAFAAPLSAQDEQPFSSLEERMTGREFNEAGLHKLSADELAALNDWIRQRSVAEYEPPTDAGTGAGAATEAPSSGTLAREPFQSRIVGEFTGWTGDTVFELENGMVWRQVDDATFYIPPVENPTVTIRPGFMDSWVLTIEGYNSSARVERVE
jgi:hypothetical protein